MQLTLYGLIAARKRRLLIAAAIIVPAVAILGLLAYGFTTDPRCIRSPLVANGGIYRYVRHPQYLGLMLIVVGFNIMWSTILTLAMAPVLVIMYVRLARREDEELAAAFGQAFADYAARAPAFLSWARPSPANESRATRAPGQREVSGTPASEEARR